MALGSSKAERRRGPYVLVMVVLTVVLLAVTACSSSKKASTASSSPAASGAGSGASSAASGPVGTANEIGITATDIHVAFIADVNTPVLPGLFQKSVDLVNAWVTATNKAGGVAGRKLDLDFCDGKLDQNATTNCVINACANDFAIISEADVLTDTNDLDTCKDKQGNATGIPNFAAIAFVPLACDKDTFTISGQGSYCSTISQKPQTFTENVGDMRYYATHFTDLHGVWVYNGDVPAVRVTSVPGFTIGANLGIKKDGQGFYTSSGSAPQSALTPIVQVLKANKSTFGYDGSTNPNYIQFRNEAQLQGVNTVKVWASNSGIYDSAFLTQAGANAEGTWAGLPELPFYTEYASSPELAATVKVLGDPGKLSNNSLIAYEAALLFQDIVNKAAATGTLSRAALFTALGNEHAFTADGLIGTTDIAAHVPSPCIVMVEVVNGKFVRQFPTKTGTFDCDPANVQTIKLDMS